MVEIEKSSGNVYTDLGLPEAEEMLIKSRLVGKIGEIIQKRKWTQKEAAESSCARCSLFWPHSMPIPPSPTALW